MSRLPKDVSSKGLHPPDAASRETTRLKGSTMSRSLIAYALVVIAATAAVAAAPSHAAADGQTTSLAAFAALG